MNLATLSNTTALWLDLACALVPFIAAMICGAIAWRNAHRERDEEHWG